MKNNHLKPLSHDIKLDYTKIPFTYSIIEFHKTLLKVHWKEEIPECVFIRDFECLPESSSYDIDLMANEESWPALINAFESTAKKNNLVFLYRTSHAGLYIVILDLNKEPGKRSWSYYEIRKQLPFTKNSALTSNDVEITYEQGMPLPSKSWRFILLLHQGLRKGKLYKYKPYIEELINNDSNVINLCCKKFNITKDDINKIISDTNNLDKWRSRLNIKYAVGKEFPALSRLSVLKRKLSRKFYILHVTGPLLFTLHGPDGVGKTTLADEVSSILSGYPFSHEVFHHISGWKKKRKPESQKIIKNNNEHNKVSILRKMLRVIYRNLPEQIQSVWVYSSNYIKYSSNLNRYVLESFYKHNVIVCDRYIYDLWAKEKVKNSYSKLFHVLHYLYCRALRKPRRAFVITDKPSEIYKRKQELSVEQISLYQDSMLNIIKSTKTPFYHIEVAGRNPSELARELVSILIKDIETDVFNIMREEAVRSADLLV